MRIGTRDSKLAVWQATTVQNLLHNIGQDSSLIYVKSPGDKDLTTPLNQFGGTGIFTKVLDDALLNGEVDIAVHSLKDYPTQAPEGIALPAVLQRGAVEDILVYNNQPSFAEEEIAKIATGSIRRVAQWKSRFPKHENPGLRGNIQTRLQKLKDNDWDGAIFAKAGLERINILPKNHVVLDWMIPAPAQGAIAIACRSEDTDIVELLKKLNHTATLTETKIERDFLRTVEGGCSAPVGALARIEQNKVHFKAGVFELNGASKVIFEDSISLNESENLGIEAAQKVLDKGGREIMLNIKNA
jgi:hydroxymethylbilane synthase